LFQMKNQNNKKGFSLIEVMVSISIITIVVLSSATLLVSIVRSNNSNIHRMVAYGLAQEGLEAMRNIRDSNWLLNASFDGKLGSAGNVIWGQVLPGAGQKAYYKVDAVAPNSAAGTITSAMIAVYAPWKLSILSGDSEDRYAKSDDTRLFQAAFGEDGIIFYTHESVRGATVSPYHRYLIVSALSYDGNTDGDTVDTFLETAKYRVTSVVAWSEYGRDTEVRLDTEITDWKQSTL
jgi:prepilin-type N-terminal cleavage/methylation domain-containing protein